MAKSKSKAFAESIDESNQRQGLQRFPREYDPDLVHNSVEVVRLFSAASPPPSGEAGKLYDAACRFLAKVIEPGGPPDKPTPDPAAMPLP